MRSAVIAQLIATCVVAEVSYGQPAAPQAAGVERNVIYGMYSGLALLLDVYRPSEPNGIGIIYVGGNAWHAGSDYNAKPLKEIPRLQEAIRPLVEGGYTVFVANHRAASRFRYPAAVEDVQRAVRFVRHNARAYGIRPDRIGAAGHSSGASLALLLGLLDGTGDREASDPIDRESARVQSVAALAPATDFINVPASAVQADYLGAVLLPPVDTQSREYKIYREASPGFRNLSRGRKPSSWRSLCARGDCWRVVPLAVNVRTGEVTSGSYNGPRM